MWIEDLKPWSDFGVEATGILAVGWLSDEHAFMQGTTPQKVFERLVSFAKDPWQPVISCGLHV